MFALSKRQCEELAGHLVTAELNSPDESALVASIFRSAMDVLSVEDRQLPQIAAALPMLQRGVGVHHSGLLPIVKEAIEVLFGEGLIKVRPADLESLCMPPCVNVVLAVLDVDMLALPHKCKTQASLRSSVATTNTEFAHCRFT